MSDVQTARYVAQGLPSSGVRDKSGEGDKLSGQLFESKPYFSDQDPNAGSYFTLCAFHQMTRFLSFSLESICGAAIIEDIETNVKKTHLAACEERSALVMKCARSLFFFFYLFTIFTCHTQLMRHFSI